ncbi:MAG: single-stranded DNA-binding protein [Polaromonas sp.]|uniref:single-stranded DNA-binding protein n=1 Tax=Polaromonas sp. TaxID=1869339 RepID=UPI00248A0C20|nr:single-stranded DNA-binding protein [Polaromonas sp.]MDI1270558.1 single-stranded DNA-binding protein [Polaromonas sp.]
MQVFGNVATQPELKRSKSTGRDFWEFRIAENQRGLNDQPTWFSVRVMKPENPMLDKGDFVKVTGKLKADFYLSREGKPSGTLLIIAFEASKIAKPAALKEEPKEIEGNREKVSSPPQVQVRSPALASASGWSD